MNEIKNPGKKASISTALAAATCTLLGGQAIAEETQDHGWQFDTAAMYYQEDNSRVKALEPVVAAKKDFGGERTLKMKMVLDTLTGASPNGAAASDQAQTFTRPSGKGTYDAGPGDIPLDDTFRDTRAQFNINWEQPLNRTLRYNVGGNISGEHDYASVAVDGGLAWDLDRKNTTLSVGASLGFDSVSPEGDIRTPFSAMVPPGGDETIDGSSDNKTVVDLVFGWTQVINARTLMQFNYGISNSSGYLNDPYKVLSVVDENGRPVDANEDGYVDYLYENRPDSRTKHSLYWKTKYHTSWDDTVDFSYRYMTDDWGIQSHTMDLKYRWNINASYYLEPHVRYYTQSEADFYTVSLHEGEAVPGEASADYRLAEFDATTFGAKVGYLFGRDQEINFRLESYQTSGNQNPDGLVGVQKDYDAYPDLNAMIVQVGYSFRW